MEANKHMLKFKNQRKVKERTLERSNISSLGVHGLLFQSSPSPRNDRKRKATFKASSSQSDRSHLYERSNSGANINSSKSKQLPDLRWVSSPDSNTGKSRYNLRARKNSSVPSQYVSQRHLRTDNGGDASSSQHDSRIKRVSLSDYRKISTNSQSNSKVRETLDTNVSPAQLKACILNLADRGLPCVVVKRLNDSEIQSAMSEGGYRVSSPAVQSSSEDEELEDEGAFTSRRRQNGSSSQSAISKGGRKISSMAVQNSPEDENPEDERMITRQKTNGQKKTSWRKQNGLASQAAISKGGKKIPSAAVQNSSSDEDPEDDGVISRWKTSRRRQDGSTCQSAMSKGVRKTSSIIVVQDSLEDEDPQDEGMFSRCRTSRNIKATPKVEKNRCLDSGPDKKQKASKASIKKASKKVSRIFSAPKSPNIKRNATDSCQECSRKVLRKRKETETSKPNGPSKMKKLKSDEVGSDLGPLKTLTVPLRKEAKPSNGSRGCRSSKRTLKSMKESKQHCLELNKNQMTPKYHLELEMDNMFEDFFNSEFFTPLTPGNQLGIISPSSHLSSPAVVTPKCLSPFNISGGEQNSAKVRKAHYCRQEWMMEAEKASKMLNQTHPSTTKKKQGEDLSLDAELIRKSLFSCRDAEDFTDDDIDGENKDHYFSGEMSSSI